MRFHNLWNAQYETPENLALIEDLKEKFKGKNHPEVSALLFELRMVLEEEMKVS